MLLFYILLPYPLMNKDLDTNCWTQVSVRLCIFVFIYGARFITLHAR